MMKHLFNNNKIILSMETRKSGYYRVLIDEWMVAEYFAVKRCFYLTGYDEPFFETNFNDIDWANPIEPNPFKVK